MIHYFVAKNSQLSIDSPDSELRTVVVQPLKLLYKHTATFTKVCYSTKQYTCSVKRAIVSRLLWLGVTY